ncbi:hypothetical protein MA16_Dca015352 [Dendrobium catenatum]|uniref:Uncharacterized protein n=1 Tax=Dendrobium catenatum TaxID=906689 RepID=A0A2I0W1E7_9ASPA|nr:hypothetical protein MA16_Dca015352 [Dendrobium catenatum]
MSMAAVDQAKDPTKTMRSASMKTDVRSELEGKVGSRSNESSTEVIVLAAGSMQRSSSDSRCEDKVGLVRKRWIYGRWIEVSAAEIR